MVRGLLLQSWYSAPVMQRLKGYIKTIDDNGKLRHTAFMNFRRKIEVQSVFISHVYTNIHTHRVCVCVHTAHCGSWCTGHASFNAVSENWNSFQLPTLYTMQATGRSDAGWKQVLEQEILFLQVGATLGMSLSLPPLSYSPNPLLHPSHSSHRHWLMSSCHRNTLRA